MTTLEEKRALADKLNAEIMAVDRKTKNDEIVAGLLRDIARGPSDRSGRIIARSISKKYGYSVIPNSVMIRLSKELKREVTQHHYDDPNADYCGDGSYTWLELGESFERKIKRLKTKIEWMKN